MQFKKSYIVALLFVFVVSWYIYTKNNAEKDVTKRDIPIKDKTFIIEIASDDDSRRKGLSNRDTLCEYCGMLFVFDKKDFYQFWMHETRFPLDILWLDNGNVVHIVQATTPYSDVPITPLKEADSVLEVPSGTVSRYGVTLGDVINLQ